MQVELSDPDWDELTTLMAEAPPDWIRVAMRRIRPSDGADQDPGCLLTRVDHLFHLAAVSSGSAFDLVASGTATAQSALTCSGERCCPENRCLSHLRGG
jgi:hypothetical protein